jgi:hypothetical protein
VGGVSTRDQKVEKPKLARTSTICHPYTTGQIYPTAIPMELSDEDNNADILRDMQENLCDEEDEDVDEEEHPFDPTSIPGTSIIASTTPTIEQQYLQHGTASRPDIAPPESPLNFDRVLERFSDDSITDARVAWCQKRFNQK